MNGFDTDWVAELVRTSALVRVSERTTYALIGLAGRSATAARIRAARGWFESLTGQARLQVAGVFAAAAAVGHLLLLKSLPPQVAPAFPAGCWALVAVGGLFAACCARPLSASWEASAARKCWRAVCEADGGSAGKRQATDSSENS
jgi:hypothetical protein